ncbi:DUF3800 domain-containing protein [bacterium]|nr:MAG: DUF3800 domain-containing protein [bacterium]
MYYLYLDESGDLGFDFVNKKPSKFFTIAVLAIKDVQNNRKLAKAVKKTLRRKLNPRSKRSRIVEELKGEGTDIIVKKYFYNQVKDIDFSLYSITLNKIRVYSRLSRNKSRVYNFIAQQVFDQIPFEKHRNTRIVLIIDRSKSKKGIKEFNEYIIHQLKKRLGPKTPFDIYHEDSKKIGGLQTVDMFAWGIHRKYELRDKEWHQVFKEKIAFDKQYL